MSQFRFRHRGYSRACVVFNPLTHCCWLLLTVGFWDNTLIVFLLVYYSVVVKGYFHCYWLFVGLTHRPDVFMVVFVSIYVKGRPPWFG